MYEPDDRSKIIETINVELKAMPFISSYDTQDEAMIERAIKGNDYHEIVQMIGKDFIKNISRILPKYLSQAFNTRAIIDDGFWIYFGVMDDGRPVGIPLPDISHTLEQIKIAINQALLDVVDTSVGMKRTEKRLDDFQLHMCDIPTGCVEPNATISSWSQTTSESDIKKMDNMYTTECAKTIDELKRIKIDVDIIPVTQYDSYMPELEPPLEQIITEYEARSATFRTYMEKKTVLQKEWQEKANRAKSPIETIVNGDQLNDLIEWLQTIVCTYIDADDRRLIGMRDVINVLEKKRDNDTLRFLLNYTLIHASDNSLGETKSTEHTYKCSASHTESYGIIPIDIAVEKNLLRFVTMFRDYNYEQLKKNAASYRIDPVVPPPMKPYTSICSCYIGSVMCRVGFTYPLYICRISFQNIRDFLDNIDIKNFYYENDAGIPMCQIRVIGNVHGTTIGPISIDKPL